TAPRSTCRRRKRPRPSRSSGRRGVICTPLMKIHEYQGKELLRKYGVPVPIGIPATTAADAKAAIPKVQEQAGTEIVVVKAQIHAGGRGKGGGVKVAKTRSEALEKAKQIYGMQLVTHQTGPEG